MNSHISFPESFPNESEERFLRVLLANEKELATEYATWKQTIEFDDIPYAVLGLIPYLYLRLSAAHISDELTLRMQGIYKYAWAKNQLLIEEVRSIVSLANTHSISVVALKGTALLLTVYKDIGARFLGDADMLVHASDAPRFLELVQQEGWNYRDPALVPSGARFGLDTVVHATPLTKKGGLELEVHWHVYHVAIHKQWFRLLTLQRLPHAFEDDEYHFQNAVPLTIRGANASMLSFEDLLVHVISHGVDANTLRPFRWVLDASLLIRSQSLAWDEVVRAASIAHRTTDILVGLTYLREKEFAVIPDTVFSALHQHVVSKKEFHEYQTRTVLSTTVLGNFPLLWYRYWMFESEGNLLQRIRRFPLFLAWAWGLPNEKKLFAFILSKYRNRFKTR